MGLQIHAWVDWPAGLLDEDVGGRAVGTVPGGTPQPFRFEQAEPADVTLPGGAVVPRSTKRFIIPSTAAVGGPVTYVQEVPPFAAFAPVQEGTLYQGSADTFLHTTQAFIQCAGFAVDFLQGKRIKL